MIVMICYMLVGLELFAYRLNIKQETNYFDPSFNHHSTFNTLIEAFISVFIVLANDSWTKIYFDHYKSTGSIVSSIYFISLIIVGQFVLMNLFISILIENFEQISVRNDIVKRLSSLKEGDSFKKFMKVLCFWRQQSNKVEEKRDTK